MTEAELSALTASLPGLMKRLRAIHEEPALGGGVHSWWHINTDGPEAADTLDRLAKVMKERDEAWNEAMERAGFIAEQYGAKYEVISAIRRLKRPAPATQETNTEQALADWEAKHDNEHEDDD